jgi:hypothetical protein
MDPPNKMTRSIAGVGKIAKRENTKDIRRLQVKAGRLQVKAWRLQVRGKSL